MSIRKLLHRLERVKLRTIFFAFLASFAGLIATWTIFVTNYHESYDVLSISRFRILLTGPEPRNIVIILSNRRSGTTFLGKIFSQRQGSFYFSEPLLPYTTKCEVLRDERVDLLTKMLDCNFSTVHEAFAKALEITGYSDEYSKCLEHTTCFANKNGAMLDDYAQFCNKSLNESSTDEEFDPDSETCGYPLRPNILSELCNTASIVAHKVVRICSLEMLEPLYKHLTVKGHRVFVIHLLRDPRAILASRLQLGLDGLNRTTIQKETKSLCERYRTNIKYRYVKRMTNVREEQVKGLNLKNNVVADGHYMRIRFEDLAMDSVGIAHKIYEFMDCDLPFEVESWIRNSQTPTGKLIQQANQRNDKSLSKKASKRLSEMVHPFGTTRDPAKVIQKWRWFLTFQFIEMVQEECADVMKELNYDIFHSYKELVDFSKNSYH